MASKALRAFGRNIIGPILSIAVLAIIVYLIYSNTTLTKRNSEPSLKINVVEARSRRFGLIIDVRTALERELLGYYPNSIPYSLDKLAQQVPLDMPNKNTWILVYSNGRSDRKAVIAAETLYRKGYKNVRYIDESYLSLMP
jgi:rhodanese-related sulfurtransferase